MRNNEIIIVGRWGFSSLFLKIHIPCMASKNRQKDLAKELEADFRRWDYLMENGGTDPFYPDGSNLNMVRRQIAIVKEKCEEQLSKEEYPELYYRDTPQKVDDNLIVNADKIKEKAVENLAIYKADGNYRYLMENYKKLDKRQKSACCIDNILGYVEKLEQSINEDDYLYMRIHKSPDHFLASFVSCRQQVEKYLAEQEAITFNFFDKVDLKDVNFEQMSLFA